MSAFRGEYGEGYCRFNRGSHVDILVLCTFITDFSTLALMVAGVLRWSHIRGRGGIWWLLYTQASPLSPCGRCELIRSHDSLLGLGMDSYFQSRGASPPGALTRC
jgi:hypothetical protein